MSNDENKTAKDDKTDEVPTELKAAGKTEDKSSESAETKSKAANLQSNSGFTQTFRKPLSDPKEDSLAAKVEDIQSQYNQIKAKKLAISGVTGAFGDLLKGKPADNNSGLEEKILESAAGNNTGSAGREKNAAAEEKTSDQEPRKDS